MLIIVGFTKPANLARIETIRQQNKHIDSCMETFTKMENLRKRGIGQESINGLAKPQMRCVTRQRGKY